MNNNKFTIKFNEKSFVMPWHLNDYPEKDEIVICRIERLQQFGFQVSILNYGGVAGFLASNELSRKKIRSIRSIMKEGDIKPLLVIKKDHKYDQVHIDLSYKQLYNAEEDINKLEKYYRLINIFHTWLKNIYNAKHFSNGKYFPDLNESIQFLINKENDQKSQNINTIQTTRSSDSISNIVFENQDNKETDIDIDIESGAFDDDNGIEDLIDQTNYRIDIDNANHDMTAANTAAVTEAKKSFPYDTKVWQKIMGCTLWKYPVSEIYDIFMKIKMQEISVNVAFPDLIELFKDKSSEIDSVPEVVNSVPEVVNSVPEVVNSVPEVVNSVPEVVNSVPEVVNSVQDNDSCSDEVEQYNDLCEYVGSAESDQEDEVEPYIDIGLKDLDNLLELIDNYINYDIIIKLNLKLTSWSYKSLHTIRTILSNIRSIPTDKDYKSGFSYSSIILNSPSYEFIIKSTNKSLMDKIYPEGCSLEESDLGQKIINILKDYENNIDYGIEIERNDIS